MKRKRRFPKGSKFIPNYTKGDLYQLEENTRSWNARVLMNAGKPGDTINKETLIEYLLRGGKIIKLPYFNGVDLEK